MTAHKAPTHRAHAASVWVLCQVQRGEANVIAVCSSDAKAEQRAYQVIAQACGQTLGRPPAWSSTPTGGKLLVCGRDHHYFQFRAEPWMLDCEVA